MESEFCAELQYIPKEGKPSVVTAFLTIANWFAMSLRSGAWTFYEAWNPNDIYITLDFFKKSGDEDIAAIFSYGIHDYQNPKYAKNYDYPKEWIEQSDKIDKWIAEHEEFMIQWEQKLLVNNKDLICSIYIG